jgi:hypothetical protein
MSERRPGGGWADFAAVVFAIVGFANAIQGLTALFKKEYFLESGLVYSNLRFWAVVWLTVGFLQMATASLLVGRASSGRTLGIVLAAGSAVVAFLSLGGNTAWSLAVLAMDLLIVYGLTTHPEAFTPGGEIGPGGLSGSQRTDIGAGPAAR